MAVTDEDELARLRLENEALAAVVSVLGSSPNLGHVLDRVVDLLTRVSGCHACFVYLVDEQMLRLRAASPIYSHMVGRIEFSVDEGLAGWSVRHRQTGFIRDEAMKDPRTNFVPELEEERFQSMAAVPVPSRSGPILGTIVLHTTAPHEFREGVLNVLTQTASLVAGAVENAQLYDEAQRRVEALTRLSSLSQRVAAVSTRADLYRVATTGARELLPCDRCRLLGLDASGRLVVVAEDPPIEAGTEEIEGGTDVLLELLRGAPSEVLRLRTVVGRALGEHDAPRSVLAVPLAAGDELLGAVLVGADAPWHDHGDELMQAFAHQIAVALKKAEIIEGLSDEYSAREMFRALEGGDWVSAAARARSLALDLAGAHVVLMIAPARDQALAPETEQAIERALRQTIPGTACDTEGVAIRALVPVTSQSSGVRGGAMEAWERIAQDHGVVIGVSPVRRTAPQIGRAVQEAREAVAIGSSLGDASGVIRWDDMGAFRYLVPHLDSGGPDDEVRSAVDAVATYDAERSTELLVTLERFLESGRNGASTARDLTIHINTLRQRLERIETITGLELEAVDHLALHLAVKLARLRHRAG